MSKIKSYIINDEKIIIVSESGNKYEITKRGCSCKGYTFRHNCAHYTEAKKIGLVDKIKNDVKNLFDFKRSEYIISMRKDAIKKFLTKHGKKFDDFLINKMELFINIDTKIDDIYNKFY